MAAVIGFLLGVGLMLCFADIEFNIKIPRNLRLVQSEAWKGKEILWLVGQGKDIDAETHRYRTWEFQGVLRTREEAIGACLNERYFIGPVRVGERLPDETTEWVGAYYPKVR